MEFCCYLDEQAVLQSRGEIRTSKPFERRWCQLMIDCGKDRRWMVRVTYQTVVGVRYPELVTFNGTSWNFGMFVTHERPQRGGFLPGFLGCPTC